MTIISTTVGKNPSEEMEDPSWSTKESEMQYLDAISKWQNNLYSFPRQTIQYHSNPIYALTNNAEESEVEQFYEDLQDFLELTCQKMSFSL